MKSKLNNLIEKAIEQYGEYFDVCTLREFLEQAYNLGYNDAYFDPEEVILHNSDEEI